MANPLFKPAYLDDDGWIQVPYYMGGGENQGNLRRAPVDREEREADPPTFLDFDFTERRRQAEKLNRIFSAPNFQWNRSALHSALTNMGRHHTGGQAPHFARNQNERLLGVVNAVYDWRISQARKFNARLSNNFYNWARSRGATTNQHLDQLRQRVNQRLTRRGAGYQIPRVYLENGAMRHADFPDHFDLERGKAEWNRRAQQWVNRG